VSDTAAVVAEQVTGQHLRDWMCQYPTGVAVVTGVDRQGVPQGMTCTSLVSITLCPPVLMVCLRTGAATESAVISGRAFAVNLLRAEARSAARIFSGPVADRFAKAKWTMTAGGLPWLCGDSFALAECRVIGTLPVGDHTIVLGSVERLLADSGDPLVYGRRAYSTWRDLSHVDPRIPD
jgi:flavin reductase (NADH)